MIDVVLHLEARTQIMLVFGFFVVFVATEIGEVLSVKGVKVAGPVVGVHVAGQRVAVFVAQCVSLVVMGVLVAFAHREGESSGFGFACDVEGGAVFVAPESVVNVVAIEYGVTLCVGLFLVVGFSLGKVVVVNKHVADAERNVFAGLVAGTDRGGPAYGLAHFVFGAEFNAAVYREFFAQ